MRIAALLFPLVMTTMAVADAQQAPPVILVYRDRILAGHDSEYVAIETDAAHICAKLRCPNPYLAIESLDGTHEVWFLNAFRSRAHEDAVAAKYKANTKLSAALADITKRKRGVVGEAREATMRQVESRPRAWRFFAGGDGYVVVATGGALLDASARYRAPNGDELLFVTAATRRAADSIAALRSGARVFVVRRDLSMPSQKRR